MTTARLTIDNFSTTLTVIGDGQPSRHNILGTPADGDWYTDPAGYARSAADRQLAALGYARSGDWVGRDGDTFTAPIQPRRPATC